MDTRYPTTFPHRLNQNTLHVFDTRDFDRTETLLEVQIGDTRKEAQSNITDKESTAPAFEDAEQTENGNYRGVDLSKPMHATLEADESYPSHMAEKAADVQHDVNLRDDDRDYQINVRSKAEWREYVELQQQVAAHDGGETDE